MSFGIQLLDDAFRWIGLITVIISVWRISLSIYRRLILPAKKPKSYGRWAVVTGSTSGIGKEFSDYLAKEGMSIFLISRSEDKLIEQEKTISATYGVGVKHIAFDFTKSGTEKSKFYSALDKELQELHSDGGIGLLINNVGTANEHPKAFDEFSDTEIEEMINCNVFSTVNMTSAVYKYMKQRKSGCVISISSGSGNVPSSFLVVYSATKAFMTQFTRSMHVECWGSGVDFYAAMPFYVVTNLCKKKRGNSWLSPIEPISLIEGIMCQIGKQFVWQGNGYWLHGLQQILVWYSWRSVVNMRNRMIENRRRYAAKVAAANKDKKTTD